MVAMLSVLMAAQGFTGIEPLFSDTPDPQWIESLGNDWQIFNLYFKPYAACRWAQPAVAGALKLARKNCLKPQQIKNIQVNTFEAAVCLPNKHPRDTEEAQYSLAFPIAAALLDGEVGPAQVLPPHLHDPDLLDLMDKISAQTVPAYEAEFPAKATCEVIIETTAGEILRSGRMEALWEPPDTLPSDSDLGSKFLWLTSPVLGKIKARRLMENIWTADRWPSLDPIFDGCIAIAD
jgi:2-methylcitrate dehydratase PrpD